MRKRYIVTAFVALVLAALACNRTVPTPTPEAVVAAPTATPGDGTPTVPTDVPPPSATPLPPGITPSPDTATPTTGTPECVYDADFVADVTIPDDTQLEPGTEFAKTWRVRNSGTCAWEPGTVWSFDSGDQMDGPDSVIAPATEPDDTADITVDLAAPAAPGTYTGYWRMRRPDGGEFGDRAFVRIIVADKETTATPTVSPTPTPTGEPGVGPTISFFRSNVEEADPGDAITVEWETEDATSATLYHLMPTGQLGSFWDVGVNGAFDYEIDVKERNHTDFLLIVTDDEGHTAQASVSITLRCPDTWFFEPPPDECPASPAVVSAGAEEHFERGAMIWIEAQDMIYVLFDDGNSPRWKAYADEWEEGKPEEDPNLTPPSGLYQPVRGFGLVWRERPAVRDRMGWAVDQEEAFTTALQRTSRARYNDVYIRALDGKVWKLLPEGSGWEKVP